MTRHPDQTRRDVAAGWVLAGLCLALSGLATWRGGVPAWERGAEAIAHDESVFDWLPDDTFAVVVVFLLGVAGALWILGVAVARRGSRTATTLETAGRTLAVTTVGAFIAFVLLMSFVAPHLVLGHGRAPHTTKDARLSALLVLALFLGLDDEAAQVYNWVSVYEKSYWNTLTSNAVDANAALVASPDVLATFQRIVDNNIKIGAKIGGTLHVVISDVVVDPATAQATATVCEDYSNATFADATRTYTPQEARFDPPKLGKLTLGQAPGRWIVGADEQVGSC